MGWSVEVHERQRLAEAAAAKRPKRAQPVTPRPIESGVWQVSAGAETVTVLATAVLAALWVRRSSARQQRLATTGAPKSLLGRLGDAVGARLQQRLATTQAPKSLQGRLGGAVAARLQALGVADWLDKARGGAGGNGSRKRRQRNPARKPAARAAGDAALQRNFEQPPPQQPAGRSAAAAAESATAHASTAAPDERSPGESGGSGDSPQQSGTYLDAAQETMAAAPVQPPANARPAQQRDGQRKKKGKGKRKK